MPTIDNITDLCAHFGVEYPVGDWFTRLNRVIYKTTECGASISVYGTLPVVDVSPAQRDRAVRHAENTTYRAAYDAALPVLTAAYQRITDPAERERVASLDAATWEGQWDLFICWANGVAPGTFPEAVITVERVPVTFHNGHAEPIPASFVLDYFTIQTIVEGSDAEVCSSEFPVGKYTGAQVDAWIEDMEAQADDLWTEANGYHHTRAECDDPDACGAEHDQDEV